MKGYAFTNGGDHLTHLGYTRDILNTGYFGLNNFYPVIHIMIAQLSLILNISPEIIVNFIGPLFYILFVFFTYVLAREIMSRSAAILAAAAATVLFSYYYAEIFPMGFAFMVMALVLFLYFRNLKKHSPAITFVLIVMVILLVLFHPIASFMLTAALLVMESVNLVNKRFFTEKKEVGSLSLNQGTYFNSGLFMLSLFCLMLWIWYRFYIWNEAILSIVSWLNTELFYLPMTAIAQDSLSKLGLSISEQVILFMKMFGHTFIYLLLSIFAIILILRRRFIHKIDSGRELIAYSFFFLPVVALWLFDTIRPLTTLHSGRMIALVFALFPILAGIALARIAGFFPFDNDSAFKQSALKKGYQKFGRAAVAWSLIGVSSVIGIFSIYQSPLIYQPSQGVSHASFHGEAWLVEKGNPNMSMFILYTPPAYRIAHVLWGTNYPGQYPESDEEIIENHFGYTVRQTVGEGIDGDAYMFLTSANQLLYTELWPQVGSFTPDDFARLKDDTTVSCIYNNGEARDYYVTERN